MEKNNVVVYSITITDKEYNYLIKAEERLQILKRALEQMDRYDFEKLAKVVLGIEEPADEPASF